MDHLRDSQIIQLFFFSIVIIFGVYLYMRSPEIPEQNTYHYVQSAGLLDQTPDYFAEDGYEVTALDLNLAEGSESIVIATIEARVPNTCTDLQKVKQTYVDREFQLTLVAMEKPYAICQALESVIVVNSLIDMGALSIGEYRVRVQGVTETFDLQTLLREKFEAELATTTEVDIQDISDLSAALGDLLR